MVNLLFRSMMVLALLFGLLFGVGMGVLTYMGQPPWIALVFAVLVIGLQYLLGPTILEWFFKIEWHDPRSFNPELADFIERVCQERGIKTPRFGVIRDGNPNAFTFGHYPGDARLVVTTGLLERLNERETEAVVGHELGHIVHWDFVIMTVAAIIPLALYVIYIATRRRRRGGAYAVAVSIASYVAYVVSQYIVLLLSRVREYYADQFAAQVTNDPEALSTALVKIAYGLVDPRNQAAPVVPEDPKNKKNKKKKQQQSSSATPRSVAARPFGIFDGKAAATMALSGLQNAQNSKVSVEAMTKAMQWDLRNPWGLYYELASTHPLPAKRIRALTRQARHYNQPSRFASFLQTKFKGMWGVFVEDFIIMLMPWIGAAVGLVLASVMAASGNLTGSIGSAGATLLLFSAGYWLRRMFSYPTRFNERRTVRDLVAEVEVSDVRPIPCALEGTVIGRGVPGLYWSEDLVLEDESGLIIMDYRQPFRILEFLFGLARAENLSGKRGRAVGWYRRTMRPYFELRRIEFEDGTVVNAYYYPFTQLLIYTGMVLGAVLLFAGLFM